MDYRIFAKNPTTLPIEFEEASTIARQLRDHLASDMICSAIGECHKLNGTSRQIQTILTEKLLQLGACPRISRAVPKKRRCHVARIYAHSVESVGQLAGSPQQAVQRAISNENHHSALGLRSQGSVNLQDIMCHAQQCPLALNFPQAA